MAMPDSLLALTDSGPGETSQYLSHLYGYSIDKSKVACRPKP
jgi:hypothetical protein